MPYIRPCKRCNELYQPIGKFQKFCDRCKAKRYEKDKKIWAIKKKLKERKDEE